MTNLLMLRVGIPDLGLIRTMLLDPWATMNELHRFLFSKLDETQQIGLQNVSRNNRDHVFAFYIPKRDIWISDTDKLIKYCLKDMVIEIFFETKNLINFARFSGNY